MDVTARQFGLPVRHTQTGESRRSENSDPVNTRKTLKQILSGGAYFRDRLIKVYPDIYTSVNERAMKVLMENDHIEPGDYQVYLHNRLTMMVPEGNPAGIKSVSDLAGDEVRIS